ncbi:hypothetical protein CJ204_05440 [Corynebacterium xerosis]|uniref:Serine/threonine protein kinase n=1 Tax=Corynebacterium xerosis TaxID=1725 RepID=A0A2N6SZF2_9CORY|nr:hypothetical protein [Corynebacterium xerosis]PMC62443.1 hypothetical protein CJ204_05440 [Corynebacterium xerosis]
MSSSDDRETITSRTLAIAIGVVAAALVFVVAVAVGLYLADGDDDPGVPTAAPGAPASRETSESSSPSPSSSSSETSENTTSSTTSSTRTSMSSSSPTTEPRDDLGTGRDDVDARGWIASRARCHDGDKALAVVATETGTRAAACQTPGGDKYYRGDAGDVGSLEAPIIVDEGDRIVARNGAWKYQMSPDGLMITENDEVRDTQAATAWGRA